MDLRVETGAAELPWAVVRVRGPDAVDYLQGQLSQDVAGLAVMGVTWTLLLEPTGKVSAWLRATRTAEDELVLDAPAASAEQIASRLERFKLRTNADIEVLPWRGIAVRGPEAGSGVSGVSGASGAALTLPADWPGVDGIDVLGPDPRPSEGVPTASPDDVEALRIEAGVPALGAELTSETIPAEAGRWLVERSVSFTKGCFTGQELVARIDSRGGHVPRPIRGLLIDADEVPPRGADVVADGTVVGTLTSSARSATLGPVALAPVRRAVAVGSVVRVRWASGEASARVEDLPLR